MSEEDLQSRRELLERIRARRASIDAFVRELEPHGSRLTNLSIVCSAVASALTAGPALGGERFADSVQNAVRLPEDSLVWRTLCLGAMLLSIAAAIATSLYKSHDVASRLSKAEATSAELEGLEALLEFGQLPVKEAVGLYKQYVTRIPFIREEPSATP